ncbi:MAG TPA: MoxR family ATPase [Thermoanaerobaculia bacterium]
MSSEDLLKTPYWMAYRGDGKQPDGRDYDSRGEQGKYLADKPLVNAVNTALAVQQPLLITGKSGTGKTMLAWSVASELGLLPVYEFHTRSDHRARDVLFIVDNLRRFYHAQTNNPKAENIENYVEWQALGKAIRSEKPAVVLIDEIDKAPRDFPNDLLDVVDKMEFTFPELREEPFKATHRPIVIITSNSERQLPDPFLRRCVFHYIEYPTTDQLLKILEQRVSKNLDETLARRAIARFEELRSEELDLDKPPSTGELIVWMKLLIRAGVSAQALERYKRSELPFLGAVIKNESDLRRL